METKYKIGEFSKLCRVTVKALRHYEQIGLLVPRHVDPWTGYRYYDICQAVHLGRILHLKRLGMSLEEIADLFADGRGLPDLDTIRQKIDDCRHELERLQCQYDELRRLEEHSLNQETMEKISIKSIPARPVASHRTTIHTWDDLGPLCYSKIGPEMMRVGCLCPEPQYCYTIEHGDEHHDQDIDIEYCEAVDAVRPDTPILHFYEAPAIPRALCYRYTGPYTSFGIAIMEVLEYVNAHHLTIIGPMRMSYIDGPWNKQSPDEYLTEVQLPIE